MCTFMKNGQWEDTLINMLSTEITIQVRFRKVQLTLL